ncbi:unnamed protein product [Brachionus calyciflorus]|uniref:Uncharacterized protein n=1 Tax=Brachionus calyciflorus TaxID=104777 RepID=A0A814LCL0_9BILA|nr:unnamed protein product [Brachionus calyciflorus]
MHTETNKKILRHKLKDSFHDWILDSTSHGFPKIFKSNRTVLKVLWVKGLCVSLGFCAFLVYRAITDYVSFEVTTSIRQIDKIPIQFPAISICNSETFVTKKAIEFANTILSYNNITDMFNSSFFSENFKQKYQTAFNIIIVNYYLRLNALNYDRTKEERRSFGFELKDFMLSCFVGSQSCTFRRFHLQQIDSFSQSRSFHLTFYNPNTTVNSFTGINILPKHLTNVIIKEKRIKKMPYPYSECVNDHSDFKKSEIYQATLNISSYYSSDLCYGVCYQEFLISKCNCSDPNRPFFKKVDICLSLEKLACEFKYYIEFYSQKDVKKSCSDHCPLECEKTYYDYSHSLSEYPTDIQVRKLSKMIEENKWVNYTEADIRNNAASVYIFYDRLGYELILELEKVGIVDLISNIGGILGLFIGISILSFAELIEIFIEILFVLFENHKKKTKVEKIGQ